MLSRRQFLQAAGIAVAAAHLPRFTLSAAPSFETLYGRALAAAPLFAAPDAQRQPLRHLWSDSVTPILETRGNWYRVEGGYTPRAMLQPLHTPAQRSAAAANAPFWGEVSGAVAVVRQWCAADAPLVTRVGHGGVMHISDRLTLGEKDWYGVAESAGGELVGWTQAANWSPVTLDAALPSLTLAVDSNRQQLKVFEQDTLLLSAPVSVGQNLPTKRYPLNQQQLATRSGEHFGAAWALSFGDGIMMTGAYWHNRFGMTGEAPEPAAAPLEVTPMLARWLYPRAAEIIIA